jgi:hypothetical protein
MKKFIVFFLSTIIFISLGWLLSSYFQNYISNPIVINPVIPKPLEKYAIENLAISDIKRGEIQIEEEINEENDFTSYLFSLEHKPSLRDREIKKTTGQLNIPAESGKYPIIVMFRGYVDQKIYETGIGTRKSAAVTTALSVLKSLDSIPRWDGENVFLWGHSNGGQVALTILEITGNNYPTVLWAPVTKSFPYSILYYTDESEDKGKYIRRELAKFENLYDVEQYSIDNYLEKMD